MIHVYPPQIIYAETLGLVRKIDRASPLRSIYEHLILQLQKTESVFVHFGQHDRQSYLVEEGLLGPGLHILHHTHIKQKNIINLKMAYLPHTFHFDIYGFSGWSSVASTCPLSKYSKYKDDEVDAFFDSVCRVVKEQQISKYEQHRKGFTYPRPFVFIPTQVVSDEVNQLHSYYIPSFLQEVVRGILNTTNYDIVIKKHPKCQHHEMHNILFQMRRSKKRIFVTEASIHEILPQCQCVVVLNSGVGFEALLYEKPVLCFGNPDYHWACYNTKDIRDFSYLSELLNQAQNNKHLIRKFIYWFLRYKVLDVTDWEGSWERVGKPILRYRLSTYK